MAYICVFLFGKKYLFWPDEIHALAIGRKIVKNLHFAGISRRSPGAFKGVGETKEPLYSAEELQGIIPIDRQQSFDIRSIISRIVDGSEFDEFKKLYGTVSPTDSS